MSFGSATTPDDSEQNVSHVDRKGTRSLKGVIRQGEPATLTGKSVETDKIRSYIIDLTLLQLQKEQKGDLTPVSLGPLPAFYNEVVEHLFKRYGDFYSRATIENAVRQHMGKTQSQLNAEVKKFENDKLIETYNLVLKIYSARKKAEQILTEQFGHTDPRINRMKLEPYMKDVNAREDLWLNCMEHLKSVGFNYYVSKMASDGFVFPQGRTDPRQPYKYIDVNASLPIIRRYTPNFLHNEKIMKWKAEELEETRRLEEAFLLVDDRYEQEKAEVARKRQLALEGINDWLIRAIQYGYFDSRILKEIKKSPAYAPYAEDIMEVVRKLRAEGYKPLDGKFKIKVELVEEPDETTKLNDKWLSCMAHQSGAPRQDGRLGDAEPFDTAANSCTFQVFKHTGKQPSPTTFEKSKKFWQPGYWQTHDIELLGDAARREQMGGDKMAVVGTGVLTASDLDRYCKNTYGLNWSYDIGKDACTDGNKTITIDYADTVRGTQKDAKPTTQKGVSVTKEKIKIVKLKV